MRSQRDNSPPVGYHLGHGTGSTTALPVGVSRSEVGRFAWLYGPFAVHVKRTRRCLCRGCTPMCSHTARQVQGAPALATAMLHPHGGRRCPCHREGAAAHAQLAGTLARSARWVYAADSRLARRREALMLPPGHRATPPRQLMSSYRAAAEACRPGNSFRSALLCRDQQVQPYYPTG